jgi:murein DD-endopeptidase MepM/ murein hydrolase activator NlpD
MLRDWRSPEHNAPEHNACLTRPGSALLAVLVTISLAGCSADIMRFDAPAFGLNGAATTETPRPLHSDGSLFDQRPSQTDSGAPTVNYAPPAATAPVESKRLADAAPLIDEQADRAVGRPVSAGGSYGGNAFAQADQGAGTLSARGGQSVTVQAGDTLYNLARRHGVRVQDIKDANGLTSNVIRPGQVLLLGGGGGAAAPRTTIARAPQLEPEPHAAATPATDDSYTVQPGDSLYAIARRTGVNVADLKRLNTIEDVRRLRPGMVLRLRDDATPTVLASNRNAAVRSDADEQPVTSGRMRPLSGAEPIILNPKAKPRISEPQVQQPEPSAESRTAMRSPVGTAPASQSADDGDYNFRWPVRGRIVRGFGKRADGSNNDGINIAVPLGTDIQASERGTVAYAGDELKGYGNLILVRHDNGYVTAYAHCDRMLVRRGDAVRRGQVIAKAGKTGAVTQPQLHFELRQGAKPVDPMPYLGRM